MKPFLKKHYPMILLILCALILVVRAFYGFCWSDETFYYSISYRFLQGDAPFYEEWYPTQLNSIFLIPPVALYRLIAGGTDGIILTFRILYVIASFGIAVMIHRVLSKETSSHTALFTALLFLFYTHLNIVTFSYYAVSVLAGVLSMLCILHYLHVRTYAEADRFLLCAGAAFAVFILSMPSMVLFYVLCVFAVLIALALTKAPFLHEKARSVLAELKLFHIWLYHFFGICLVAVPFSVYFFTHVSAPNLISSLAYVLTDEEHEPTTMYVTFRKCFSNLSEAYGIFIKIFYLLFALSLLCFILKRQKTVREHFTHLLLRLECVIAAADVVVFAGMFFKGWGHTGYVQIALLLFSLPLFFLDRSPNVKLFLLFVVLGGCMAFSYTYTSSGSPLYTESIGFALASVVSPAFIMHYTNDLLSKLNRPSLKVVLHSVSCCVILMTLLMTMTLRMTNIYRDDLPQNLTARIPDGPAAGIMTSPAHLNDYSTVLSTIETCCTRSAYPDGEHNLLLISKLLPWGYLCSDMKCASPYSWRSPVASERLSLYYGIHPDRYPDVVLVLDDHFGSYEACGDVVADPIPNQNDIGGDLYQYMLDHHFKQKSVPCGTLYVR